MSSPTLLQPYGRRVLVTGGSRGIGLACAEALAHAGCNVVLNHYADAAKAETEARRLSHDTAVSVQAIEADVGDPVAARALVRTAAERLGGLDIVVSNAGICRFTAFLDLDDTSWRRHAAVNFDAGFYIGQEAARIMIAQGGGGRLVFTTSIGARRSNGGQVHYCATKAGLSLLAQGIAIELAPHRITANCIAPGWIHTDINDAPSRDAAVVEPWLKAHCPAGRLGRPEDLKSAVLFLCAAGSDYVTGSTVGVDGGWNAQL
ncbi:MAG TPA: SDR family NAD(P)-dependent oxidoreductase [Opitutaceae bacterium]|nr:SDR family NAD(P)-dependent oxidoreductase [Opitutaceae bacterium]